ncbi:protease [Plasmodium gonderi]|uniref:Protease n=1 Tax=Plasmodium gonderi TaxID=77519 RepID=A0A1Y1JCF2_PLAGO|nr:protease [Plasmodium gonderi]GAW80199.1 protease [Plasmodium gonderi]
MVLNLFCIVIIFQLYVTCFTIRKTNVVIGKYGRIANGGEKVKSNVLGVRKQFFTYKRFQVHLSDDDKLKKKQELNEGRGNLESFYHKNCNLFKKAFGFMKSGLTYVQENILTNSLKSQLTISISFFLLHFYTISRHFLILFPYQLIPNHSNILMSLDLNNTLFFLTTICFLKRLKKHFHSFKKRLQVNGFTIKLQENKKKNILSVAFLLIASYVLSGYVSIYTERILSLWKIFVHPVSENMVKSIQILTGHFIWVACSIVVFKRFLYPYFVNNESNLNFRYKDSWCFDVVYGYLFSHFVFSIVDVLNNLVINHFMTEVEDDIYMDNSIDDIVNGREFVSTLLCIISPCFSAPFFEEFIYRFFVLKSLNLFMHIHYAVMFSSLFFAIHHLNIFNLMPLFFLSFLWSYIYIYTDNVLVTMLIHSFWNIYVFLTSLYN